MCWLQMMWLRIDVFEQQFAFLLGEPGITAAVKSCPADFVVVETLSEPPLGFDKCEGEHIFLKIRKTGTNTHWLARQLADFAGVPLRNIGYAGRKDRHAITTQWFSVYLANAAVPDFSRFNLPQVELLETRRHRRKLRKGDALANHFDITLRCPDLGDKSLGDKNLDARSLDEMTQAHWQAISQRISHIQQHGMANYFGEQRFGLGRNNLHVADRLLRSSGQDGQGKRGEKGKNPTSNRDIYLSAARAWLFNMHLSNLISVGESLDGLGPLYGKSRDPQPGEDRLNEQYAAWVEGLRRLGVKAGQRALTVRPTQLEAALEGDRIRLKFGMPSGAYASSLIRELVRAEDMSSASRRRMPSGAYASSLIRELVRAEDMSSASRRRVPARPAPAKGATMKATLNETLLSESHLNEIPKKDAAP